MLIVDLQVTGDRIVQTFAGAEAVGVEPLGHAAVEALDHADGLRVARSELAVLDGVVGADAVEWEGLRNMRPLVCSPQHR